MSKHTKLIIGSAINIVTGIIGFFIWQAVQTSVRMAKDLKELAGTIFLISFIPALVFFVIWYFGCDKANSQIGKKRPAWVPYFLFGLVTTFAISVACSLFFFDKAIIWAIVSAAIATVGTLISYLTCEPK